MNKFNKKDGLFIPGHSSADRQALMKALQGIDDEASAIPHPGDNPNLLLSALTGQKPEKSEGESLYDFLRDSISKIDIMQCQTSISLNEFFEKQKAGEEINESDMLDEVKRLLSYRLAEEIALRVPMKVRRVMDGSDKAVRVDVMVSVPFIPEDVAESLSAIFLDDAAGKP